MVMTEFTNLFQKKKYDNPNRHYNLSSSQWQALRDLASNPDIVIRSADKGGGIVIMDSFYYHQESLNILGDSNYYLKLPNDPTNDYLKELYELLEWGFEIGVISKKERDFLKSKFPTMAFFYFLPKIHKNLENPPGRPIISGIGSLTANISSYLDTFLQRFVIALPSYLRDTGHLLNILKDQEWKENYLWASLDVKSLYSNIDHGLGIEAVKNFLRGDPLMPIRQQDFLLDLLRFVLTHNYFSFEDMIFLQTKGTAMGAKCAPSYANLFMGAFEEFFNINGRSNTVLYKRYIDDLLLIWRGSHDSLKSLVFELNQNNWGLEFTSTIHESNIVFLDLDISICNNTIITKTFFKKTDTNSFLDFRSSHQHAWKTNVPFGQIKRIRRNCTMDKDFTAQVGVLQKRFLDRKYPRGLLTNALQSVNNLSQNDCLVPKVHNADPDNFKTEQARFITRFSRHHKLIKHVLIKYWPLIRNDHMLGPLVSDKPCIIHRRAPTIKNIVAPSKPRNKNWGPHIHITSRELAPCNPGVYKCGSSRCKCCPHITHDVLRISIPDSGLGEQHEIKSRLDCGTSYVVYL
ncbi:hypothetical protein PRIEUP_LOCUS1308, partial [Pristimantis euphronides]